MGAHGAHHYPMVLRGNPGLDRVPGNAWEVEAMPINAIELAARAAGVIFTGVDFMGVVAAAFLLACFLADKEK